MERTGREKTGGLTRRTPAGLKEEDLRYEVGELDSSQRESASLWAIYPRYAIEDGQLVGHGDNITWYQPGTYPDLPFEFAKLQRGDEDALLKFVRQWGRLGYSEFQEHSKDEPIEWVWTHSETVRFILDYLEMLQAAHSAEAPAYASESQLLSALSQKLVAKIAVREHTASRNPEVPASEREAARLVRGVLEGNLSRVVPHILYRRNGTFQRSFGCDTLIEHIYWHLTFVADGSYRTGRCKECDHYFRRGDARQEFCPSPTGGQSLCGKRYHTRKWRKG